MKKKVFIKTLVSLTLALAIGLGFAGTANGADFTLGASAGNTASWSNVQKVGTHSAHLYYVSGDRAYVEIIPAEGTTVDDLATITNTSWWYYASAANGPLMELRFKAASSSTPDGAGHVDVNVNTAESSPTIGSGKTEEVTNASTCTYFGNDLNGDAFWHNTGSMTLAGALASINAQSEMSNEGTVATAWELIRVRMEIGWGGSARNCYIDDIEIFDTVYDLEDQPTNAVVGIGVVSDEYFINISGAITNASVGDTIFVGAGTYAENLLIDDANLVIKSTGGLANTTIEGHVSINAGADNFVLGGATGEGFTCEKGVDYLIMVAGPDRVTISYNAFITTRPSEGKG